MYLYVKAMHVCAVVLLIGGMLMMALALRVAANGQGNAAHVFVESILRWDAQVTTPALGIVWIAGFTMAFGAGWSTSPWLLLKLGPALALSFLHTLENVTLRRFVREGRPVHRHFRAAPLAIVCCFALVAWLAVAKPF